MNTRTNNTDQNARFEVVIRSGPRLSAREAETAAKLLAVGQENLGLLDEQREDSPDYSPEAFLRLIREPGREIAVIRENKDLVGVILTSAPPAGPYVPVRRISRMAFWVRQGRPGYRRQALQAALRAFQEAGISVIAVAGIGGPDGPPPLFENAGMRPAVRHSEICWLLSKVLEQREAGLGAAGEQSRLSHVADLSGRSMRIKRVIYCADAVGGSGFQLHHGMVKRQMLIQHREKDINEFRRLAQTWKEMGLYILSGFSGTIIQGSGDEPVDGWNESDLGLDAGATLDDFRRPQDRLLRLPAGRLEDLTYQTREPRPGFPDFLLWALRMAAPCMLLSTAPRFKAAPLLSRPFSDRGRTTLSDMIEALFLTDLVPDQTGFRVEAYGQTRYSWRIKLPGLLEKSPESFMDKGRLMRVALDLLKPDPRAPLVFFGGLPADEAAATRLLDRAYQGAPVVILSFSQQFTERLDRLLTDVPSGRAPVLGFTADDFFDAILILEALGLSPSPLM